VAGSIDPAVATVNRHFLQVDATDAIVDIDGIRALPHVETSSLPVETGGQPVTGQPGAGHLEHGVAQGHAIVAAAACDHQVDTLAAVQECHAPAAGVAEAPAVCIGP